MQIDIADDELRKLYEDPDYHAPRYGRDVVKAFRKKVGLIVAATSELDLRSVKSLHFEKLAGNLAGQHSIRLNDQWRLLLRLETTDQGTLVVIIKIDDYH
jgi:toxin HigB-1